MWISHTLFDPRENSADHILISPITIGWFLGRPETLATGDFCSKSVNEFLHQSHCIFSSWFSRIYVWSRTHRTCCSWSSPCRGWSSSSSCCISWARKPLRPWKRENSLVITNNINLEIKTGRCSADGAMRGLHLSWLLLSAAAAALSLYKSQQKLLKIKPQSWLNFPWCPSEPNNPGSQGLIGREWKSHFLQLLNLIPDLLPFFYSGQS